MSRDWKDTLLMPKTQFEMKAGLIIKEPKFREFWNKNKIYEKALKQNENNKIFRLHDGPPYANGSLHVGHALNKILKDIIIRNKTLNGYKTPFTFGWDTHGLPIENKMLSELKMSKDDIDAIELRKQAAKFALLQVEVQAAQFEKMQLFANLKNKYITLDKNFEVEQLKLFKKMTLDGLIYKGMKPVYWSPSSQSALAEAEVEYKDHRSPQVIVSFMVEKGNEKIKKMDNLLIMTTTPWTFIANSGVGVGENFDYDIIEVKNNRYIVASKLTKTIAKLVKWDNFIITETIKGKDIIGIKYKQPIDDNKLCPVVAGHHVTTDAGTGLVHIAPLFGEDDYIIGKQYDLELIMHVDGKGNLTKEAGKYKGKFYADVNKDIGMFLDSKKHLHSLKFIKHSYPHDWRTNKPVIYRGTPQWFVSIKQIKKDILHSLKDVKSNPWWGVDRISKMIESRNEWTISRQRTWGVPIIIFYDENDNPVIEEKIFDYVINLVRKNGTNIWWEKETDELLPKEYRNKNFTREMDIMDVWFDSGSSFLCPQTIGEDMKMMGEYDVYLEGTDQYRGWFNSSLINSVAYNNKSPYKTILSHGFVLDGKQQKMSKSKGNVIDPLTIIKKNGADVLRLWAANSEYTSDVTISDMILKQNIEIYRRIRNSFKFMLGNLFDFTYEQRVENLEGDHALVNEQLNNLIYKVNESYESYKFINVVKDINKMFINLSSFYFSYCKDTLYVDKYNSKDRRSVQTNIYNILDFTLKAIAPIIPTTAEEAYSYFNKKGKKESIFLDLITKKGNMDSIYKDKWKEFFEFKDKIYKTIEESIKEQKIKRNNEAFVKIKTNSSFIKSLDLRKFLMVGKIEFTTENSIHSFDSEKCQRCWNHFDKGLLTDEMICQRCNKVVN